MRLPRLGIGLVSVAGLLALAVASMGPIGAQAQTLKAAATTADSSYVSVTPTRILDTRTTTPLATGGMLQVPVPTSVVPAGASAVVLNVTAVAPTAAGFITVLPGGETLPTGSSLVSNLNFAAGAIVPNLVTVGLSATGTFEIYNYTGSTNVVVDVEGYYTSTVTTSGLYNPMTPIRVFGSLPIGTAIGAGATTAVPVAGASAIDGVPATASAVVLNVTAAHATLPSFLTVFPAGASMPTASNLNFPAQAPLQAIANRVTVGVGTSGNIDIYNLTGTVNVDVDVDGYYGSTGSPFVAITPVRVADTVTANKVGSETSIAAAATETFTLATADIPANAAGVAMNLTAVPGAAPGYLTSYPTSTATPPVASDVNWTASEYPAVPNFTIADTAGTGIAQNVDVANSYFTTGAPVDVIADAFGYFAPSTAGVPTMVSAAVTHTAITITYNQPVSCAAVTSTQFTYDWTGTASGGSIDANSCTTIGDVLTLTGTFTLPSGTATVTYTIPTATNTTLNSVYATGNATEFAATQTIGATANATVPAMVSAYATSNTLVITYNEAVSCDAGGTVPAAFAYNYTGSASGLGSGTITAACATDQVTLTTTTTFNAPTGTASITYTAPTTTPTTTAVWATGSVPPVYAATQTLSGSMWTTPAITAATVTPGASGTILVTYGTDTVMTCPTAGANTVQTEFAYSNGGATAYPSVCTPGVSSSQLTLSAFKSTNAGITAETLVLPGAADTLTYTAPSATNTTVNSVYATLDFPQFPATQTFTLTATPAPTMTSAVVTSGTSIAILYNAAVSCPATGADGDFVYDSSTGVSGGTATGCSGSGTATLTLTGAFNVPLGSASLTYNEPGAPSISNAVYLTGTTTDFVVTQTLSGAGELS